MTDPVATQSHRLLQQLQDRLAISQLIHRYCLHFDRNEPEAIARLFTEDAVVDYGPEVPPIHGRDAIHRGVAQGLSERFAATSHHVSNIEIEFDGEDSANSHCYLYAWHRYHGDGAESELWGQYHHRLVRSDTGWRIAELRLTAAGSRNFHRARMHPIGRR